MGKREIDSAKARKAFGALLEKFQDGVSMRDLALVSDYIDIYHGYGAMSGRALLEEEVRVAERLLRMGERFVSTREWNRFRLWFLVKLLTYFAIGAYIDDRYVAHASWMNWYAEDAIMGLFGVFVGVGLETLVPMGFFHLKMRFRKGRME